MGTGGDGVMAKLGEICTINPKGYSLSEDVEVSFVSMTKVGEHGEFDSSEIKKYSEAKKGFTSFQDGDVLFAKITPCMENGKGAIAQGLKNGYGFGSTEFHVLHPHTDQITAEWLYYLTTWDIFRKNAAKNMTGSAGQKRVPKTFLENYSIDLPDVKAQNQQCRKLKKVDFLISLRKQQLAKLDELVKARFVEMFGDIIRNDKSWPIHNFSDIASSRLGKMLDAKQQTGKYSYPYLANFNVQWFSFNVDNLNQMDFNEAEQKEFELRDGDLLVCEGGEIGRCAVWHNEIQPCFFQKALHRVRCNRQLVHPDYLAWWFKYNCNHGGFAEIAGAKATIAHLPGIKLKQLQVALPPLSLQNEFAAFVERVDQQKQTVQQSLEKLELMKKALMQEYFG